MKKILLLFLFAMAMHATMVNAQSRIEHLQEKHRVDGWSFSGNFAWGYTGLRPHTSSYNHSSVYAFVPYQLPNFPEDRMPTYNYWNSGIDMALADFSVSATRGLTKRFRARTNLFYRTRQTDGWNVNTSSGGFGNEDWSRTIGSYESTHQIGLEVVFVYDLWGTKKDKQLNLLLAGGSRYFSRLTGYDVDGTNDHSQSFQGHAKETYRRTDISFSFGLGIERVHFFHKNWGYSLGLHYDRIAFTPNRMTRTELTLNGEDQLPNMDTRQTDFRFGNAAKDNPDDNSKPRVLPKENYNFNVIMFRAGICYRL